MSILQKGVIHITIPSQEISIGEGEEKKTFLLEEMPADAMSKYVALQAEAADEVRAAIASQDPAELEKALREALIKNDALYHLILGEYEDAWGEKWLRYSVKQLVLDIMDELNGMDKLMGNLQNLAATMAQPTTEIGMVNE